MSVASDYAGLYQWLVADSGTYNDQSGNGRNATPTVAPAIASGVANTHDVYNFDGASYLSLGNLSALTQGEIFIVVATKLDPPTDGSRTGIASLGTNGNNDHYPYTDGNIYNGFGSTNRYNCGNPALDLSADLRVLNVRSAPGSWALALNNVDLFTSASNTVSFTNAATLGKSVGGFFLAGYVAEFILYSALLSSADRAALTASLLGTYAGGLVPPPSTARVSAVGASVPLLTLQPIPTARVSGVGASVPLLTAQPIPKARVSGVGASVVILPVVASVANRSRFYIFD